MRYRSWLIIGLVVVLIFTSTVTAGPVAYTATAGLLNPSFEEDSDMDGIPDGWYSSKHNNILSNSGFEEGIGTPTDWTSEGKKANSMDNNVKRSGQFSARLMGIDGGWTGYRHKDIPVEAGATYLISAYVKTENVNEKSKVYLHFGIKDQQGDFVIRDNDPSTNNLLVDTVKGTHDWMKLEAEYTIPDGGATISYLRARLNPTAGTTDEVVWYDDLVIRKVGGIDSDEQYTGNNSLKVVGDASSPVVWWSDEIAVQGGRIYNVGAHWKTLLENGNAAIIVEMNTNDGTSTKTTDASANDDGSLDWKKLSTSIFIPQGIVSLRLGLQTTGLTTVWFDDVWLTEELDPQPAQLTIVGDYSVKIPDEGNVEVTYSAIIYDQFEKVMEEAAIRWLIDSPPIGVTIDEDSGLLTITNEALSGSLTIKAQSTLNPGIYSIRQVELQPSLMLYTEKIEDKYIVYVTAKHVGDLYGYELLFQYDKSLIELSSFETLLPNGFALPAIAADDKLYVAGVLVGDVESSQGTVPLAAFELDRVKQDTAIALEAVQLVDGNLNTTNYSIMQSETLTKWNDSGNGGSAPPSTTEPGFILQPEQPALKTDEDGIELRATVVEETGEEGITVTKMNVEGDEIAHALDRLAKDKLLKRALIIKAEGNIPSTEVELPIQALINALKVEPDLVITLISGNARYDLPLKAIDFITLTEQAETNIASGNLRIFLSELDIAVQEEMDTKAVEAGITLLGKPYEFRVSLEVKDGMIEIDSFGQIYVSRSITIPKISDHGNITGLMYDPASGSFSFVPSYITKNKAGLTEVNMLRPTNSIYTIGSMEKTFEDMQGHWANGQVEQLASRLIIQGTAPTKFAPSQLITRAEFTALIVRALGLNEDVSEGITFSDVKSNDWYAGAIGAAANMKLVEGFADRTFRANEGITREEVATILVRAMLATGKLTAVELQRAVGILQNFEDANQLAEWSNESVTFAVDIGIIQGTTKSMLEPRAYVSRAQAAVMLNRMLIEIGFITP